MRYHKAIIPTLAALLVSSCLTQQQNSDAKKEESDKNQEPPPLCLGAVHQVYPEQSFVLLRMIGPIPAPGTTLITHPPDGSVSRLGNLCVTTEKSTRNNIIAADVRAGTVLRGDRVFLYRNVSKHKPKEEEEDTEDDVTPPSDLPTDSDTPQTPENEHPSIVRTPVQPPDSPAPFVDGVLDDTDIEQTPAPEATPEDASFPLPQDSDKSIPLPSGSPGTAPSYLDDIPDNIGGWN